MRECRFYIGGREKSRRIDYRQGERSVSRRKESGIDERDRVQERNVGERYRSGSGAEVERLLLKARNVSKNMTFPTGLDFRKYSDEELTAMLVEAREASKHARKRGRVMGIVAAHRLKQMRTLLMYEELATWRRENGFDREMEGEESCFTGHRSLPPTPQEYYASLWCEVNALKDAISMPLQLLKLINAIEQDTLSDEEYATLKRCMEKRVRETAQVTAVTRDHTVQPCSPCSPNPDRPSGVLCNLENEGTMSQELEELTSSSTSTGLNTPGQLSPPNEGVWETGRITADSFLTAGVNSSQGGKTPSPPERSTSTRTFADIVSTAAIQENRRLKTFNELNKPFDPGGRGEKAPPWNAAVPLPFYSCGKAGRLLVCLLCLFFCFPKLLIYPGETYQQAERRGSWTPIKSLIYATGGQALSRLLPYLKMAMTSNARFDRSANTLG